MSTANDEAVLQTILSPLLSTCADDETNVKHGETGIFGARASTHGMSDQTLARRRRL